RGDRPVEERITSRLHPGAEPGAEVAAEGRALWLGGEVALLQGIQVQVVKFDHRPLARQVVNDGWIGRAAGDVGGRIGAAGNLEVVDQLVAGGAATATGGGGA